MDDLDIYEGDEEDTLNDKNFNFQGFQLENQYDHSENNWKYEAEWGGQGYSNLDQYKKLFSSNGSSEYQSQILNYSKNKKTSERKKDSKKSRKNMNQTSQNLQTITNQNRCMQNKGQINKINKQIKKGQIGIDFNKCTKLFSQANKMQLINKIKEMTRRKQQHKQRINQENQSLPKQKINDDEGRVQRAYITPQLVQRFKVLREQYNSKENKNKSLKQRMTYKVIANQLGISITKVYNLFFQYLKDPLFINRFGKTLTLNGRELFNCDQVGGSQFKTNQRINYIKNLLKTKGQLSVDQIITELNKVDQLTQYDQKGNKQIITREIVEYLMKFCQIENKDTPTMPKSINSEDSIKNRALYSRKYVQIAQDKNAVIYFMGQYSFANNLCLSSCPFDKRDTFVQFKSRCGQDSSTKSKSDEIEQSNNLQYLLVMSTDGVQYYQIYQNIFQQINLTRTLTNISLLSSSKNPKVKKYLIIQTSFLFRRQTLLQFQQASGIKIIFLPPKTPMLNPTYFLFKELAQKVKLRMTKYKYSNQNNNYPLTLTKLLDGLKKINMQSYFVCVRPYLQFAIREQPFK